MVIFADPLGFSRPQNVGVGVILLPLPRFCGTLDSPRPEPVMIYKDPHWPVRILGFSSLCEIVFMLTQKASRNISRRPRSRKLPRHLQRVSYVRLTSYVCSASHLLAIFFRKKQETAELMPKLKRCLPRTILFRFGINRVQLLS